MSTARSELSRTEALKFVARDQLAAAQKFWSSDRADPQMWHAMWHWRRLSIVTDNHDVWDLACWHAVMPEWPDEYRQRFRLLSSHVDCSPEPELFAASRTRQS